MADNIKVVIKVRPLIKREFEDNLRELWAVNGKSIYPIDQVGDNTFTFDHIFDSNSETNDVYETVARPIVEAAVDGMNGTIFAYGQTSSGKTYTMMGDQDSPGVIPLAVNNIFEKIGSLADRDFLLRVSYIEIYNEKIKDLLDINKSDLKIHEDFSGPYVKAHFVVTSTQEEILDLMKKGNCNRAVGETQMNERSSRSHTIFFIIIESRRHMSLELEEDNSVNVSQLNLVDLAGSERACQTGTTKQRLKEGGHINKSLSALGIVIRQLSDTSKGSSSFVSFRDSKLTHFLKNSLGGNSKTGIICAVTPAVLDETQSTLMFAMSAKAVQNKPTVNATISDATHIKKLTKEIAQLHEQLKKKIIIEVDNKFLQEQLSTLTKMILMGNVNDVPSSAQKAAALRRRTWCAPRYLPPIMEHRVDQTLLLKNYKFGVPESSNLDFPNITRRSDLNPNYKRDSQDEQVLEIIELDDTPEASPKPLQQNLGFITPPNCSPSHKCFGVQQTPPCILKHRARRAEKEFEELQEMTSLEKMYAPEVVELLQDLNNFKQEKEMCSIQIQSQKEECFKYQEEIQKLKSDLQILSKEKDHNSVVQLKLQQEMEKYRNMSTDLQFEMDILTHRFQNREKELLASLAEARKGMNEKPKVTQRSSLLPQFLNVSQSHENDIQIDDMPNSQMNVEVNDTQLSLLQEEIKSLSSQIDSLKINLELISLENSGLVNANTDLLKRIEGKGEVTSDESTILKIRITELEQLVKEKDTNNNANKECAETEIQSLTLSNEEKKTQICILNEKLCKYNSQISTLNEKLSKYHNDQRMFDEELSKHNYQITQLNEELNKRNDQIATLSVEFSNDQTAKLNEELTICNDQINTLKEELLQSKNQITKLNEELSCQQNQTSILNGELSKSNDQITMLSEELTNRNDLNTTLNKQLSDCKCQISELLHSKEKLELTLLNADANHEHENEMSIKSNMINELNACIKELEAKVKQLSDEHSSTVLVKEGIISDLRGEIAVIEIKVKSLEGVIENNNKTYWNMKSEINELKQNLASLTNSNMDLNEHNSLLEEKCETLQNEIKDKDDVVDSLKDSNNNLNLAIERSNLDLQESKVEFNNMLNKYQTVIHEKQAQDEELQTNIILLEKAMKDIDQLESLLSNSKNDNNNLNNALTQLKEEMTANSEAVDELSQELSQSKLDNELKTHTLEGVIGEVKSLKDDFDNVMNDITKLSKCFGKSNADLSYMKQIVFQTNKNEFMVLKNQLITLLQRNVSLEENSFLENKENVSLKIEKTPHKQKHNVSVSTAASPLDTVKSKFSSQIKNESEIFKLLLDIVDNKIETDSLSSSCAPDNAEFAQLLNKIMYMKSTLQQSNEKNKDLHQKVVDFENEAKKFNESLRVVDNELKEIHQIFSESDALYSNSYNTIKKQIQTISSCVRQHLNSSGDDMTQGNVNGSNALQGFSFSLEEVNDFVEFLENSVKNLFSKLNYLPEKNISNAWNVCAFMLDGDRFTTVKSECTDFCREIENLVNEQREKLCSVQMEYDALINDKINAEREMYSLCEETEELFKKVVYLKNESAVFDAETTLKSSILSATEHYHSNLHSTFTNTLSFFKDQLLVLQKFLENPDLKQREIVDIYSNIITPGLELVKTPFESSKIFQTRTPMESSNPSNTKPKQISPEKIDKSIRTELFPSNLKADCESLLLENKELKENVLSYECFKKKFEDLNVECDSLSAQLMDSLEDTENYKNKAEKLEQRLQLCQCKNCDEVTQIPSGCSEKEDDNSIAIISACCDYVTNKIVQIKSDFIPHTNLFELISFYVGSVNDQLNSLQSEISILKKKMDSLNSTLETKSSEVFSLQEKVTACNENEFKLQKDLLKKDDDISDLQKLLNSNSDNIKELTKQLEGKSKLLEEHKRNIVQHEEEKKVLDNKINMYEEEKMETLNQINLLETRIEELERKESEMMQANVEYCKTITVLKAKIEDIHTGNESQLEETLKQLQMAKDQINHCETMKTIADKQIVELQGNLEQSKQDKIQLEACVQQTESHCITIQEDMRDKIDEFEILKKATQNIQSDLTKLQDEKERLENIVTDSEKQTCNLKTEIHKSIDKYNTLLELYNKLKENEAQLSSSLNDLKQENQTLNQKLDLNENHLKKDVERLQNTICEKDVLIQTIQNEMKDKNSHEIALLKDQVAKHLSEKKQSEEEILSLLSNNNSLSSMLNDKDSELHEKNNEISLLKASHRNTISLQVENEKLKNEIHNKNESINSLEGQLQIVNNKLNGVTSQLVEMSSLKSVNSILENKVSDLQTELNGLLRSSSKVRSDHLHLKRQSLHDTHRNLTSCDVDCNDISMEDCTGKNSVTSSELQDLENKYKTLEDKHKSISDLYATMLENFNKKSEEYNKVSKLYIELQAKYKTETRILETKIIQKVNASTNTTNNRPEDNVALMDMFVDKLTHNHLKEKYNSLIKINEDFRYKHKEQAAELRRLQHSLQDNTLHKLLPQDEEKSNESKLKEFENEMKELRKELGNKQKEYKDLEEKYNDMDKEYDTCVQIYQENLKSFNDLSLEKKNLEVQLKNIENKVKEQRRDSPINESRRKRQHMHDVNRCLTSVTTDSSTNTSPKDEKSCNTSPVCMECASLKADLEQLRHKELVTRLNVPQPSLQYLPMIATGSGIVQNHHLSNVMVENQKLRMKLKSYKEYVVKLKSLNQIP